MVNKISLFVCLLFTLTLVNFSQSQEGTFFPSVFFLYSALGVERSYLYAELMTSQISNVEDGISDLMASKEIYLFIL